ncbi:profilin-2-like isoform X2 [Pleurodeles waltl]|uniref:profilin-2-like isoform X2 n=1 Tax=Pleurodeles waltl TaxID=8319 RepID=UPI003709B414
MSGWQGYITSLQDANCREAAIVGYNPYSVWACTPESTVGKITAAEVATLTAKERSGMFINGVTVGGQKCSLIRDNSEVPDDYVMDLKTKSTGGDPTVNIAIGRTCTALVICMGEVGTHGGKLNDKAHNMTKYLRGMNL